MSEKIPEKVYVVTFEDDDARPFVRAFVNGHEAVRYAADNLDLDPVISVYRYQVGGLQLPTTDIILLLDSVRTAAAT